MSTLSTQEKSLLRQALAARENAYAPYSRFQVGAVLTVADGSTFCGCNIENASYSMTICAERSSVCAAVSAGVRQFRSIAIVGGTDAETAENTPCPPCGACLQVLAEFCPPDFPVCVCGKKPKGKVVTRKPILPSEEELERKYTLKKCEIKSV